MKATLVHDWLTGMRGGEKCLEALCELYPEADLFTLVHRPGTVSRRIEDRRVVTSWLQSLPRATRWYRYYLPLMPWAIEAFDLDEYDLVLSTSHCVAKGVLTRPDAVHICYVHSPMRYVWDQRQHYFPPRGLIRSTLMPPVLSWLRQWDVTSSARVDHFIANSQFVRSRIEKYYRRDAVVIHPPVDCDQFGPAGEPEDYYLIVGALVPYKGIEVALRAFEGSSSRLVVVGKGPLEKRLRAQAGPQVEFRGWVEHAELRRLYAGCRALILPSVEDFGLSPLEANASGRPAIALGRGGALDSVRPVNPQRGPRGADWQDSPPTGVFYYERSPEALREALRVFEEEERAGAFRPQELRAHALGFDRSEYKRKMNAFIDEALRSPAAEPDRREAARPTARSRGLTRHANP